MGRRLERVIHHVHDREVRRWMRKEMSDSDFDNLSFHSLFSHLSHPGHKTYERILRGLMDEDGQTIGLGMARIGKERFLRGLARMLAEQE